MKIRNRKSRHIYKGHKITVTRDSFHTQRGQLCHRDVIWHPGAAAVLVIRDGRILLQRQYRYALGRDLWEIPAGTLEKGEAPLTSIRRELEEEAGLRARRFRKLLTFAPNPGISSELIHLYAVTDFTPGRQALDDDEFIFESKWVSLPQARRMIRRGEIEDGKTIMAILFHASRARNAR